MTNAFLGVERSLLGRRWQGPAPELDRAAAQLQQQTALPDPLCRVLAARNVPASEADAFLEPRLRDLMPDPSTLRDMDAASQGVLNALDRGDRIAVFADYDVDGGASAALLMHWLRGLGVGAQLYVPDRIDEGYGPNIPAMEALAKQHKLIICVDCGTLSFDPIAAARAQGADVIVLDHHQAAETLPDCAAVVNPNRQDETGEYGYLCAAGVVFLLLVALNRDLRARGKAGPDLLSLLDLVALATVADVAPLMGLNRALVQQGLKVMAGRNRPGLVALSDVAGLRSAPSPYHLGFALGPRINAGGRVGAADLGARLLISDDPHEAGAIAARLDQLNAERREIEAQVLTAATQQVEARGEKGALAWAAAAGWHPGVVGIVASRLKDAFGRPAIVIGLDDAGLGRGSGRSVEGVDLGAAIAALMREGLIEKGGGHAMAAGLSLSEPQIPDAMARLEALIARQMQTPSGPRPLRIDGALTPMGATPELVDQLERAGPFGAAAPAPRFALPAMRVGFAKQVGESHLKLSLRGDAGGALEAIAFRAFEAELGPALSQHGGAAFHIAGRLEINDWGGRRRVQFRIEDAAPA